MNIQYLAGSVSHMTEIDTRTQILTATEARFIQYGYNKTTMAEIARDCGMSAANLYRYFENKLDIGAALANQCLFEKEQKLSLIVNDNTTTSAEKLKAFIDYVLDYTYHHFDASPRIGELIEAMTVQRPDVADAHRKSSFNLLRQLLDQGEKSNEFTFDDLDDTAEAINTAIVAFYLPTVMPMFSLQELEHKAKVVLDLILNSIGKL